MGFVAASVKLCAPAPLAANKPWDVPDSYAVSRGTHNLRRLSGLGIPSVVHGA